MANILKGKSVSVIATSQSIDLGDATVPHTLVNDGAGILFYRRIPRPTSTTFAGTGDELRAIDASELKVGESAIMPGGGLIQCVCGSDTGATATMRVLAGALASAVNLDVAFNAGNVGLLNAAETEINPSTEEKQDDLIAAGGAYTTGGVGTATITGTTSALGDQACRAVVISAHPDNDGRLWVAIGADAELDKGFMLAAGDRIGFAVSNTSMVHAIAATTPDVLTYQWVN